MGSALRATSMLLGFNTDTSAGVELNSCRFAARLGTLMDGGVAPPLGFLVPA